MEHIAAGLVVGHSLLQGDQRPLGFALGQVDEASVVQRNTQAPDIAHGAAAIRQAPDQVGCGRPVAEALRRCSGVCR